MPTDIDEILRDAASLYAKARRLPDDEPLRVYFDSLLPLAPYAAAMPKPSRGRTDDRRDTHLR